MFNRSTLCYAVRYAIRNVVPSKYSIAMKFSKGHPAHEIKRD